MPDFDYEDKLKLRKESGKASRKFESFDRAFLFRLREEQNLEDLAYRVQRLGGELLVGPNPAEAIAEFGQELAGDESLRRELEIGGEDSIPLFEDGEGNVRGFHLDRVAVIVKGETAGLDLKGIRSVRIYRSPKVLTAYLEPQPNEDLALEQLTETIRELNTNPNVVYAGPSEAVLAERVNQCRDCGCDAPRPQAQCPPLGEIDLAVTTVGADRAWGKLSASVRQRCVVAVLDTAVDVRHPDLAPAIVVGYDAKDWDFSGGFSDPGFVHHGTNVAGTVAAVRGRQNTVVGIATGVRLLPVTVGFHSGNYEMRATAIREATRWLQNQRGLKMVMNLSWVMSGDNPTVHQAIEEARKQDVLIVAGVGNRNADFQKAPCTVYPALYAECLKVAAIGEDGRKDPSSNHGPRVQLCAPGFKCTTNHRDCFGPDGKTKPEFGYFGETSAAAAIVSGAAALVRAANPNLRVDEVEELLHEKGLVINGQLLPVHRGKMGRRVRCEEAVEAALQLAPL